MRRLFPVVWIFPFVLFGISLVADECRGTNRPVSDLIEQLRAGDPDNVCAAARALGNHPPAKDAVPALKQLLKSPNGRVKWTAAETLWRLKHTVADLVPVYAELLTATEPDVRAASAWRLGRLGSDARPAVPVLAAALRDESLEVRVQVGQALANLGELAEPALPALVRALGDRQLDEGSHSDEGAENVRRSPALPAVLALGEKAIPSLIESFRERGGKRRHEELFGTSGNLEARAAHAFPAFGKRAVPPLLRALEAKDADTRRYATLALREVARLSGLPNDAVDKLEGCLDDPDKGVSGIAASAMSWARPSSTKAVTILAKSREEDFGQGDLVVLAHLERMGPHNKAARRLLMQMLGDDRAETAQEAHRILAELGLPADQVLGVWTKALSHADQKVRNGAISALAKLGPSAKSAISALHQRFTKEPDYYCKGGILDALVAIAPDDPALVPLLRRALDDRESWVRYRARNCIADLGPRAKDLLPRLEASLSTPKANGDERALDSSKMRDLVGAIVRIAPGSARTAATLLQALRHRGLRAVHCPKNTWYMRDRLEDELHATLPAARPLLREALTDRDVEVRRSAALVLLRAGLDTGTALPVLMENLWGGKETGGELSRFQRRVVKLLSRRRAPATADVAASWCKAWQTAHPEERAILEPGLLVLQPEALPHLLKQLREATTSQRRRHLAHLLARFEGQSKVVLPILRKDLRESKLAGQYTAAQALIHLGPDATEAVPELVRLLNSPHPAMRAVAAQALSGVGRAAKPAVPGLKAMLRGPTPEVRIVAASALGQIDPTVSEALVVLRDAMIGEKVEGPLRLVTQIDRPEGVKADPVYPASVEESITRFGERAVPVLADILDNVDLDEWSADNLSSQCGSPVRVRAALLLAELGPDAEKAVPALIRALDDRDPFIRDAAASALGRIGPAAKAAAPACIALFEKQNRLASTGGTWDTTSRAGVRSRAASHLGHGGPFDFRSLGRGRSLSRYDHFGYGFGGDPYAHVRPAYPFDAPHVLSRIDSKACSALPVLAEAAKSPDHPARLAAALSIWRCGRESPDLMRAFAAVLENRAGNANEAEAPLPREVRECLVDLGTELRPAIGVMADWLKQRQSSAEEKDLIAVVEALGHLGADARSKAGLLRPMLQGDRWNARRRVAAALALFRILGNRDLAFPVLRDVLLGEEEHASLYHWPDMSETARTHAARALGVLAEKGDERARSLLLETTKGDENPHVRVIALEAMARQKETNSAAVRGLCAVLRHPDGSVRLAAAAACGRLGPLAKASARALTVASEDSRIAVRHAAILALAALD